MATKQWFVPLLILASGCASTGGVAPNRNEIARLKESTTEVHAITYAPAPFTLLSAGKVAGGSLFGIVGGAVAANSMQKAGQELITTYNVSDPAIAVRERLAATLASEFGLQSTVDTAPASDALPELKGRFGNSVVLDTRTINWQLLYYPTDWTHHHLAYAGRARLLRLSDGKVLWLGKCTRSLPDPKGSRRTVDDYRANNGELLKQKVQELSSACTDELIAQLAGRPVPSTSVP